MRVWASILLLVMLPSLVLAVVPGLRVADGFDVLEYSDSSLANDITCMTLDSRGQVIVSGRGYIRRLIDSNNDGRADKVEEIITIRDAAHGLLCEKDLLYYVADGALHRVSLSTPRNKEIVFRLKTGGEHDAHAIRRGPDGWLYLLCGNSTGIDKRFVHSPTSPIREPIAGVVIRFSPDFSAREIVADGFRNPYDFTFSPEGELFTYDSDNERCVSLPWYEPTRCYHVVSGGHYGWQNPQHAAFWRMPPHFPDVVAPVCNLQRGSPTGVAWQSHPAVPSKFHGLYLLDWTFGRIWHAQPQRLGSTFSANPMRFLEAIGGNGFAPTAIAVHPRTGDLFVSIGGRGTRGGVYRIQWTGQEPPLPERVTEPVTRSLDWSEPLRKRILTGAGGGQPDLTVLESLTMLWRHRVRFSYETVRQVIVANWNRDDRLCRQALSRLVAAMPKDEQEKLMRAATQLPERLIVVAGLAQNGELQPELATNLLNQLVRERDGLKPLPTALVLEAWRFVQLSCGGLTDRKHVGHVWEGYSSRKPASSSVRTAIETAAVRCFPSSDGLIDFEISRTLAMVEAESPTLRKRITQKLTNDSNPIDDIHWLIVLSRMAGHRDAGDTKSVATAMLLLEFRLVERKANRDRNWPQRIAELHAEHAKRDSRLNSEIVADEQFGKPEHVLFVRNSGTSRRDAVERLLTRATTDQDYSWSPEIVALLKDLPKQKAASIARSLVGRGVDDSIIPILAALPMPEDIPLFLRGVTSPSAETVRHSIVGLTVTKPAKDKATAMALVRCMMQMPKSKVQDSTRKALIALLEQISNRRIGDEVEKWTGWLTGEWSETGKLLSEVDGVDLDRWKQRLAKVAWNEGRSDRGRQLFVRSNCANCHSGNRALGPDLAGVSRRFSRDDLITAIIQPNRDVPERYQITQVETSDGKVRVGLIIYDAVDGVILQLGSGETVRIDGSAIEQKRKIRQSLMPAGLIDSLTDAEVADLIAYLSTLGQNP
jgi:putative heme-binding domain-containing protein